MTINLRLFQSLPDDFLEEHPELEALHLRDRADINHDGQLGIIREDTNEDGTPDVQFNEAEYLLYLQSAYERSNQSNLSEAQRTAARNILTNPRSSVPFFLNERRAGRLNQFAAAATTLEQNFNQALSSLRLSLGIYNNFPRTFRDHIAPNYFRDLAQLATWDTDANGEVTIPEVNAGIRREVEARIRAQTPELEQQFRQIDTNSDGNIDVAEFRVATHAEADANVQESYNQFDNDHQNGISLEEFKRNQQPNISDDDYQQQAQGLMVSARRELEEAHRRLNPTLEQELEIDRISSRISSFDFSYLDPARLTSAVLEENNIFRILTWMKTQCPSSQTSINSTRTDELLQEAAMDNRPLMANLTELGRIAEAMAARISQTPDQEGQATPNATKATEIRNNIAILTRFRERFNSVSPHDIISEQVLQNDILANPLALNEVRTAVASLISTLAQNGIPPQLMLGFNERINNAMRPLLALAGQDAILTRDDLNTLLARERMRIVLLTTPRAQEFSQEDGVQEALRIVAQNYVEGRISGGNEGVFRRVREEGPRHGLSNRTIEHIITHMQTELRKTDLQGHERPHFLEPLWTKFAETQIDNPEYDIYPLSIGQRTKRIEGSQLLARATIHYIYLHPTNTLEMIERTERNELFFLIEHVIAGGIRDRARSHADDGVPGVVNLRYEIPHGIMSLPANISGWAHSNISRWIPAISWRPTPVRENWRQRIANHADAEHQQRLQAIQALRLCLEGGNHPNLRSAIEALQDAEQKRILTEELHVPELERIFYIPNSAEQEVAFTRFATYTLRDQVNPERGILEAFRRRFLPDSPSRWSLSNLAYDHWQLRNAPGAATFYDRLINYSEHTDIRNEAIAQRFDLRGNGGDANPMHWAHEFSDDEASIDGIWDVIMQQVAIAGFMAGVVNGLRLSFGMGGPLNRFFTGFEYTQRALNWRNSSNPLLNGAYWTIRRGTRLLSTPLHRELSSELNLMHRGVATSEVDLTIENVLASAENTSWSRPFRSFLANQSAGLEANSLLFNRNPQVGAANLLRLSQTMVRVAEEKFTAAQTLLSDARTLARGGNVNSAAIGQIETKLAQAADLSRQAHALRELAMTQQQSLGLTLEASRASTEFTRTLRQAESISTHIPTNDARLGTINRHLRNLGSTRERLEGLGVMQEQMAMRGALPGGSSGLQGLTALSENRAAALAAARMVNPATVLAQNPALQGRWQLYFLGWLMLHEHTLGSDYRHNLSLQEWALEQGIHTNEVSQEVLESAYKAHRAYRGSRQVFRDAFLNAYREANEAEPIRGTNLHFPTAQRTNPESSR